MVVKITKGEVHIKEKLTWGQREEIIKEISKGVKVNQAGMQEMSVGVTFDAKYKLLEMVIEKIIDNSGKEIAYSKEWFYNLDIDDGDKIFTMADELSGGTFGNKKKEQPPTLS